MNVFKKFSLCIALVSPLLLVGCVTTVDGAGYYDDGVAVGVVSPSIGIFGDYDDGYGFDDGYGYGFGGDFDGGHRGYGYGEHRMGRGGFHGDGLRVGGGMGMGGSGVSMRLGRGGRR
jgi:hypothetical protein